MPSKKLKKLTGITELTGIREKQDFNDPWQSCYPCQFPKLKFVRAKAGSNLKALLLVHYPFLNQKPETRNPTYIV